MVLQTYITAHPSIAPYPQKKPKYIIPIKKGGRLEFLFNVVTIIDCVPDDIYNYSKVLTEQQYLNLIKYHQHRKDSFGYSRPESPYRFYILDIDSPITQPFERKNIQVSTWINFSSIPKIELINKENSCDDGFATNEEDICNIHEGHLIRLMVNKYERNPIARKNVSSIMVLNVQFAI